MKIDTPQILWHSDPNGKPAPLYSISILSSSSKDDGGGRVVATAGNCSDVNLWKVLAESKIQHVATLSRHERSVNVVKFSPNGRHLITAGDGGTLIVWSVPTGQSPESFWNGYLQSEKDLDLQILSTAHCQDIMDVSWSADSQRFATGSIDRTLLLWEMTGKSWTCEYRNVKDHEHYVQGVVLDPLGVYMASQGSDRSVKVIAIQAQNKKNLWKTKSIKQRTGKRQYWFADESTVESFFRRLDWTPDGAFLLTPAGLYNPPNDTTTPSFATLLFARHNYDQPYKVLTGLEKPSVVVRANPVCFELPPNAAKCELKYRSVFAVLTLDAILIYDTYHSRPLAIAKGLHYAGLTDCAWSSDGHTLMVTSTDGYVSILTFSEIELGAVYHPPITLVAPPTKKTKTDEPPPTPMDNTDNHMVHSNHSPIIQPMEDDHQSIQEPEPKKQKRRIQPVLITTTPTKL